ncbi:MAG TPA: DUF2975 domain-containing protein [Allosphingosinicella sp.]|jgi:hypothetical protein
MSASHSPALALARTALRAGLVLNLLFGAFLVVLLAASLAAEAWVMTALGANPANSGLVAAMRAIMVLGLASVPLAHVILTRLLAIVETVRFGDPFVAANAARLQTIAWALLGLELLHLAAGAVAALASSPAEPLDIGWSFSLTGWLAVLLLFVLARVFDQGAAMRADLEGTV